MAERRLKTVAAHLLSVKGREGKEETKGLWLIICPLAASALTTTQCFKHPDDIVIVSGARTAIGKAGPRGSLHTLRCDKLLLPVLRKLLESIPSEISRDIINDVAVGTVLGHGGRAAIDVRIAALLSGLSHEVPISLVNRQCGSGLQAIAMIASMLHSSSSNSSPSSTSHLLNMGMEVGIAAGVESMSTNPRTDWTDSKFFDPEVEQHEFAKGLYMSMGQTSEEVSKRFGIQRKEMDLIAFESHRRAHLATKEGRFRQEIVPLEIEVEALEDNNEQCNGKERNGGGEGGRVNMKKVKWIFKEDEGIRGDTTLESLSKLKPVFAKDGTTTAGNSSQLSDGASGVLMMRRSTAVKLGIPSDSILGTLRSYCVKGVEPSVMGIGPVVAIPLALKKAKLQMKDMDLIEINEAFSSQVEYCLAKLSLDRDKVNVNGGGIALGHPLGSSGVRIVVTLLHEMKRRKARYGLASMCMGSGMGAAAVFEASW